MPKNPTFIVDRNKAIANLKKISDKVKKHNLIFRPHFKTHQSRIIGEWFKDFGINKITVSSLKMAKYFANSGWNDITIAFPLNLLEMEAIKLLSRKIKLSVLLTSIEAARVLYNSINALLGFYLEIDTGYHRSGILADDFKTIDNILKETDRNKYLKFKGFLTHAGDTYQAKSIVEIKKIHHIQLKKMKLLKAKYKERYPDIITSIGDTPTISLLDNFEDIDEVRPGNFIFYDLMQFQLGVCRFEEIAVCVCCPVVDKSISRNEIVIYGGAVHLSKESIKVNNKLNFGQVVKLLENYKWHQPYSKAYVSSLSQEHGIITTTRELTEKINIGECLGIIPVHSCLTANLSENFYIINNKK